jgi:hypothetical protein
MISLRLALHKPQLFQTLVGCTKKIYKFITPLIQAKSAMILRQCNSSFSEEAVMK